MNLKKVVKMILHKVYMTTIDLQAKIHYDFERIHGLDLNLRELYEVIADYEKYCSNTIQFQQINL